MSTVLVHSVQLKRTEWTDRGASNRHVGNQRAGVQYFVAFLPASEGARYTPTHPAQAGVGWTGTRNLFQKEKLCLPT